jgi:Collagen triple helix repeat (20 copies)
MLSNIRKRVKLTPSGVIAVMALVFATTGGAFAMNGGGGSSPSRASASLTRASTITATAAKSKAKAKAKAPARGPAGPQGKTGTAGPAGPAGEKGASGGQGPQGSQGPQGPEGKEGKEGKQGEPGKPGASGPEGKSVYEPLPVGKTEIGVWSFGGTAKGTIRVPISLPIPLEATQVPKLPIEIGHAHYVNEGESVPGCGTGTFRNPEAEEGNLCVYSAGVGGLDPGSTPTVYDLQDPTPFAGAAGTAGAFLSMEVEEGAFGAGTWAVTASKES